jgi:hypothetical protein
MYGGAAVRSYGIDEVEWELLPVAMIDAFDNGRGRKRNSRFDSLIQHVRAYSALDTQLDFRTVCSNTTLNHINVSSQ